jgi:DNA-binding CsgD family transcriptional regulator
MKSLSLKDLPKSYAVKLFELGYEAGNCRDQANLQKVLKGLLNIFPAEAVVCGYGAPEKGVEFHEVWTSPKLANISITRVLNLGWPVGFLQTYLRENMLARDGHSYACLRTNRAKLWLDVYNKQKRPFDPMTKRGIDPKFVEISFDHGVSLALRKTHIDHRRQVSDFSLLFRRRGEAHRFGRLFEGVVPYLHDTMLRVCEPAQATAAQAGPITLSRREREVLKWLIEGKSNWEIGQILHIVERTVKFHIQNLMRKLEATNRFHLVANACQKQLNGHSEEASP